MKKIIFVSMCILSLVSSSAFAGISNSISVNDAYATVTQRFRGTDAEPTLVIVEDLHMSYQAQQGLVGIIADLIVQTGTESLFVEGSSDTYDLQRLHAFPFPKEKRSVMLDAVRRGIFTGAEAAQALSPVAFSLVGVEDPDLFWNAHSEFVFIASRHKSLYKELETLKRGMRVVAERHYNESLKKFDAVATQYEEGGLPLNRFIPTLYDALDSLEIDYAQFLTLLQFRNALVAENQVHFPSLDGEIEDLTKELMQPFGKEADYFKRYISGAISQQEIVTYLYSVAMERSVSLEEYMNIPKAIAFWRAVGGIDSTKRDQEILKANYVIRLRLATTSPEREMITIARDLQTIERLLLFEASDEDVRDFIAAPDQYNVEQMIARITALVPKAISYKVFMVPSLLRRAELFYSAAIKREERMVETLYQAVLNSDAVSGIFVVGQGHLPGITKLLRDKKISYVTVRPKGNNATNDVRYMDRMLGYVAPIVWPKGTRPASMYNASLSLLNPKLFAEMLDQSYAEMEVALLMDANKRVLAPEALREKLHLYAQQLTKDPKAVSEFSLLEKSLIGLSYYIKSGALLEEQMGAAVHRLQGYIAQQSKKPALRLDAKTMAQELQKEKKITSFCAALDEKSDRDFSSDINVALFRKDFTHYLSEAHKRTLLVDDALTADELAMITSFADSRTIPVMSISKVDTTQKDVTYYYVGIEPTEAEERVLAGLNVSARVYVGTRAERRALYLNYFDVLFLALTKTDQTPIEDVASPENYFLRTF